MMAYVVSTPALQFLYRVEIVNGVWLGVIYDYNYEKQVLFQEIYLTNPADSKNSYKGDELLEQLSTYGKDVGWVQSVSQKVREEDILGLWFEKGSGSYSLDNLGNLEIKYDDVLVGLSE